MYLKMYKKYGAVLSSLFLAAQSINAQTDSLFLTIDQLFERGVQHSLQLQADVMKESMAQERIRTARSAQLPELQIGLKGGFVGQPVVWERGLSDPSYPEAPDWSQNYAIDLAQPLYQAVALQSYDDYIVQAYENDPAMRLLRAQTELARNEIRSAQSLSLPSVSLYASNTLARPVSRTLADMYNNNWNVGVSVSYPLSSLYKNNHKVKESKLMVSLRKNEEEQKMQGIRMDVRSAFLRHREALQRVEALKLSVRQAEENYRIMQNRYLNQLAILTDLLDANSVRLNVELQLVTARTRVIYTYYQLQKACGRL